MVYSISIFTKITLSIFVMFILISCRKDNTINIESNCYCCGLQNVPDQIELGDLSGMNIIYPNSLITTGYNSGDSASYFVDIDQDYLNDFQIKYFVNGSYTSGPKPYTSIVPLNVDSKISAFQMKDTNYYYLSHSYYNTNPVYHTITHNSSCQANSSNDSINWISSQMRYYESGDLISISQFWTNQTLFFRKANSHYYGDIPAPINDTVTVVEYDYKYSCNNVETGVPVYIGIKKLSCDEEKLGWIKLTFNSGSILVSEFALQK